MTGTLHHTILLAQGGCIVAPLDWIGWNQIGLDQIALDWIKLDRIKLDQIGLDQIRLNISVLIYWIVLDQILSE